MIRSATLVLAPLLVAVPLDAQRALAPRHQMLPVGSVAASVALGDLDGDGDLDAFGVRGTDAFVQENDGGGLFLARTDALPAGAQASALVELIDLDGDGDLDALSATAAYVNDGAGAFTILGALASVEGRSAVAAGDVDGDGDLDLVVGTNGPFIAFDGGTRLLRNDAGTYVDATAQLPAVPLETRAVALGDVDGDGDLDVVLGNVESTFGGIPSINSLFLNDGAGTFTDASGQLGTGSGADVDETRAVLLVDLDVDGDLDLVVSNEDVDRLYRNDGAGTFTLDAAALPIPWRGRTYVAGDVDGNGTLDLVNENGWLSNDGTGTFALVTSLGRSGDSRRDVAVGDVDGDGDLDVYLANASWTSRLYLNDGTGTLVEVTHPLAGDPRATGEVLLADLDGDDDLDGVLVGEGSILAARNTVRLLENVGLDELAVADAPLWTGPGGIVAAAAGDVDADGDVDLLVGRRFDEAGVLVNDGSGALTEASGLPPGVDLAQGVALADVDGDGDLDAYLARGFQGLPPGPPDVLWTNDGAGGFTDASGRLPGDTGNASSVAVADVDGDGDPDVLVGNFFGEPLLLANDGSGTFADVSSNLPSPPFSLFTNDVAFGDLDGDGDLDAFLAGQAGPPASSRLLRNDGTGAFDDPPSVAGVFDGVVALSVELVDLGLDGDLDVLFSGGPFTAFENQGSLTFVDVSERAALLEDAFRFVAGDLDLDGDADLVTTLPGLLRVLHGPERHLAWRSLPRVGRTVTMDVEGPANGAWVLACSPSAGELVVPPFGTLLLDAAALSVVATGLFDASGRGAHPTGVPADPALAGTSFLWQAAVGPPFRFTNRERTRFVEL